MYVRLIVIYTLSGVIQENYYFNNMFELYAYMGYLYFWSTERIDRITYVLLEKEPEEYWDVFYTSSHTFTKNYKIKRDR